MKIKEVKHYDGELKFKAGDEVCRYGLLSLYKEILVVKDAMLDVAYDKVFYILNDGSTAYEENLYCPECSLNSYFLKDLEVIFKKYEAKINVGESFEISNQWKTLNLKLEDFPKEWFYEN
jgi:hypothetical protein